MSLFGVHGEAAVGMERAARRAKLGVLCVKAPTLRTSNYFFVVPQAQE